MRIEKPRPALQGVEIARPPHKREDIGRYDRSVMGLTVFF
jgi:hypothetical protein